MRVLLGLLLLSLFYSECHAQPGEVLKLLSRSHETVSEPDLSTAEWRWLREHRKIRLAVWQPMSPPYDITTGMNDYGGINADFIGLAAENLGVDIEVLSYADHQTAIAALRDGKADFIAQAGDNQRQEGLILSDPYSANVPVEIVNTDTAHDETVKKIAISPVYDPQAVQMRYPGAEVVTFSSDRHALEALAFRKIDLFISDTTTARYLVYQSNLSNLSIRPVATPLSAAGFSFAALPKMQIWITILNKLLKVLPENASVEIHRRWNGGIPLSLSEQQPVFTYLEKKWIKENTQIRVAVAGDNAPVAYFDSSGQLRGIIADILTAISLRTGFNFDITRYPTQQAAFAAVKKGNADLVAGVTQENIWQADLLTTRTWLYNSWVMVGRAHYIQKELNPRIIGLNGEAPEAWFRHQYTTPAGRVDTWSQGLNSLVHNENDMMAVPLIVANTLLTRNEFSSLKILAGIDTDPMRFAFGASRHDWPLVTILDKALINIPPEDLHALTRGSNASNTFIAAPDEKISLALPATLAAVGIALLSAGLLAAGFLRRRRLTRLLNAIPVPVYLCDAQGRVLTGNRALCEALSIDPTALRGNTLSAWFSSADIAGHWQQRIVRQPDRVLRLWRRPVEKEDLFIGGWIDVSRQSQLIQTLRRARRRADSASRIKSTFLATMSHEIRTPIAAITGMLELVMKRPGDTPQNQQSVRIAWDAAQSLLLLIGNILDVSRIESGRLVLRPERAALRQLIESTAMLFEGLAAQKSLGFSLEIDADLNGDVLIDATRFRQIIVNLLGNAIKFTDGGSVTLRAQQQWHDDEQMMLCLEVEDTGEGIDEATRLRLFRPFEQGENPNTTQGSGLGLYICRTLAEMMGGGIDLHSVPGKGTRAVVLLKLSKLAARGTSAASPRIDGERRRALDIVIVDDHPAGRMLLDQQLSWLGHRVTSVGSSQEALDMLENRQPDVVISDCNMPGMNGYQLARTINARYPALPVFGLTADAREVVRDDAQKAGMRDCLFKPVTLSMLKELLAPVMPTGKAAAPAVQPQVEPELRLPAVLLEGDNLPVFLALQITVLDETLAALARWYDTPDLPLYEALHKLRGGVQLLGAESLAAQCLIQEQAPDERGIRQLEADIRSLRASLQRWQETGLHPCQTVLQQDEDEATS